MSASCVSSAIDSDSDDDVWNFKPLKRVKEAKKKRVPNHANKLSNIDDGNAKVTNKKPSNTPQKDAPFSFSRSKTEKIAKRQADKECGQEENVTGAQQLTCPLCQMPYKLLMDETRQHHTEMCLERDHSLNEECVLGSSCKSTSLFHYREFRHSKLAKIRAKPENKDDTMEKPAQTDTLDLLSCTPADEDPVDVDQENNDDDDNMSNDDRDLSQTQRDVIIDDCDDEVSGDDTTTAASNSASCDVIVCDDDAQSESSCEIPLNQQQRTECNTDNYSIELFDNAELQLLCSDDDDDDDDDDKSVVVQEELCTPTKQQRVEKDEDDAASVSPDCLLSQIQYRLDQHVSPAKRLSTPETKRQIKTQLNSRTRQSVLDSFMKSSSGTTGLKRIQTIDDPILKGRKRTKLMPTLQSPSKSFPTMKAEMSNSKPSSSSTYINQSLGCKTSSTDQQPSTSDNSPVKRWDNYGTAAPARGKFKSWGKTAPTANVGATKSNWQKKICPFYKKIPGTPFTVDAFSYGDIEGCKAYFLSHFHYDHYMGLRKSFQQPIYCSKVTGNLVSTRIRVDSAYIHRLPMNIEVDVHGVKVILLEANHCPGAVLFLFRLPSGTYHLHTGDFRAHPNMEVAPLTAVSVQNLYLDTTYCDPTYSFPPQDTVIAHAVRLATSAMRDDPRTLIVVGSYTIGKERVFTAIAEALRCSVYVSADKRTILGCLEDEDIDDMLTNDAHMAKLHVLQMNQLKYQSLAIHLDRHSGSFSRIVGFEPTGWTHNKSLPSLDSLKPKINSKDIVLYGIPYSEHSSYTELQRFVRFLKPHRIIPTVNNGNRAKRGEMEKLFRSWLTDKPEPKQTQLSWR